MWQKTNVDVQCRPHELQWPRIIIRLSWSLPGMSLRLTIVNSRPSRSISLIWLVCWACRNGQFHRPFVKGEVTVSNTRRIENFTHLTKSMRWPRSTNTSRSSDVSGAGVRIACLRLHTTPSDHVYTKTAVTLMPVSSDEGSESSKPHLTPGLAYSWDLCKTDDKVWATLPSAAPWMDSLHQPIYCAY